MADVDRFAAKSLLSVFTEAASAGLDADEVLVALDNFCHVSVMVGESVAELFSLLHEVTSASATRSKRGGGMSDRPTPQRLADAISASRRYGAAWMTEAMLGDLLGEVDALTKERDQLRAALRPVLDVVGQDIEASGKLLSQICRERDAALEVLYRDWSFVKSLFQRPKETT